MPNPPKREEAVKCPITNRWIRENDSARWCSELNVWIHPKGEEMIFDALKNKELDKNPLYGIILADWQPHDPDQSKYHY